jgi:hypothetical protein
MAKKRKIEDVCFPVPKKFSMCPQQQESNEKLEVHIFRQTIQVAFGIRIPYSFTSKYNPEPSYQLVSDEQTQEVLSLFQAFQPKDAIERALAQQFIVAHIQAMQSPHDGHLNEIAIKKIELTHQVLETLNKYRTKGAQLISVQYNHNQGQINNVNINKVDENKTIEVN